MRTITPMMINHIYSEIKRQKKRKNQNQNEKKSIEDKQIEKRKAV